MNVKRRFSLKKLNRINRLLFGILMVLGESVNIILTKNIANTMTNHAITSLALFIALFSFSSAEAQRKRRRDIIDFKIIYDSTIALEVADKLPIGIILKQRNGKVKKTRGYAKGRYKWKKFDVKVSNGYFKKGTLYYDPAFLYQSKGFLNVEISPKRNPEIKRKLKIQVPQPVDMDMKVLTDGIIRPYTPSQYTLRVKYSNGKWYTHNSKGKPLTQHFAAVRINGIKQSHQTVELPHNTILPITHVSISVYTVGYNKLSKKFTFPVKYDIKKVVYIPVLDDHKGLDGSSGSCNGGKGENGQSGSHGAHAPNVKVHLKLVHVKNDSLLHVKINARDYTSEHWISCNEGMIQLINRGGNGGSGGAGGRGGSGRDGTEKCEPGTGGEGGNGGNGGNGGDGGSVTIYCSEHTVSYSDRIEVDNKGGNGGTGGTRGRGGRGGYDPKDSFWVNLLIRGNRGSRGSWGRDGYDGENGPEKRIRIISRKQLLRQYE